MPTDVWESLAALVQRGDDGAVAQALQGLAEAERRTLAKRAQALARQIDREPWEEREPTWWTRFGAASALVIGTAGAGAAVRARWLRERDPVIRALILQRPPDWRQEWAERTMDAGDSAEWIWGFVHELVCAGAIAPPEAPGYVRHAVTGLRQFHAGDGPDGLGRSLADVIRIEPDFLEHGIWRLLELEDSGLTARGHWLFGVSQTWTEAIVELAGDGTLDRRRLLDSSLAALRRDWSPYDARWHHQLHEALEPTADEHVARLGELLALLASSDAAVVGFALRALGKLEKAGGLDAAAFLDAVPPALLLPTKSHALRAVKLVGRVLKRSPDAAPLVLPVLVDALAHEAREVQEAVLTLLERHPPSEDERARVAELVALVDPAVRDRVAALTGEAVPAEAAEALVVPPVRTLSRLAPRLGGVERLTPVTGMDDLLERAAVAVERGDDPDELELLLDGISRLRREPVEPGRREALLSRAVDRAIVWDGRTELHHARAALGAVVIAWLDPERELAIRAVGDTPPDAIAQRVRELVEDLGGPPRPLLAAPTHRGGWIDPREGVRRMAELKGKPLEADLAQMLMRLAPDARDEARRAAEALSGEAGRLLSRALGGEGRRPRLSKLKVAWAAAECARDPDGFAPPRHEPRGDAASWSPQGAARKQATQPPASLLTSPAVWWSWEPSLLERWLATVWPANREPVYRIAAVRVKVTGRGSDAEDILELLLDPSEPVGPEAASALALALAAEDLQTRTLAADVAIAALESRRMDGAGLGERLARVLRTDEDLVAARWGPSLEGIATAGPLHAHEVQAAIERVLAVAGGGDRRRLLPVVELLRRLAAGSGRPVSHPAARAWLEAISGSSKIARAAREALAVSGPPASAPPPAPAAS